MKKIFSLILLIMTFGCNQTPDGMTFIEGGDRTYGSNVIEKNNIAVAPETKATIDSFYMDIFEVTNEQYKKFITETGHREPSLWMLNGYNKTKTNHPVTFVKLSDATKYCDWLDKTLPTEVQWEVASGGNNNWQYAWGNEFQVGLSNTVTSKIIGTSPVGSFPEGVSPYGVMDMTGNVLEWTTTLMPENPDGYEGEEFYITKGGSWGYSSSASKTYHRFPYDKESKTNNLGFRCVKN